MIGEAGDGAEAVTLIERDSPDLVFLDLQMPGMGGFEVVRQLKRGALLPVVVIVTAYDEYAIQAFDTGAVDYLLKPVSQDRLAESVDRARRLAPSRSEVVERIGKIQEIAEHSNETGARKIVGRSGDEFILLNAAEVFAFQAEGDLVWIVTAKGRYLATHTLRTLQEKLHNSSFRRIHRNALVNVNHVRKLSALSSQRWLITLSNNVEFIVSKRQAKTVRELVSW